MLFGGTYIHNKSTNVYIGIIYSNLQTVMTSGFEEMEKGMEVDLCLSATLLLLKRQNFLKQINMGDRFIDVLCCFSMCLQYSVINFFI